MKKFMAKLTLKALEARRILRENKGDGAMDTVLKILIALVTGSLLLTGLVLILNNTVLPGITTKIGEIFNYRG